MKALTLTQPWATLVAIGAKRIETRSWHTRYRGPLAIHAAKGFPPRARKFTTEPICYEAVKSCRTLADVVKRGGDLPAYPLGCVLAVCRLVDCRPTTLFTRGADMAEAAYDLTLQEESFGDYSPGRFAWILDAVQPLPEPIPAKGMLGLWEWSMPE